MQFNYYFLKSLTTALNDRLVGLKVDYAFSQNKDELILVFNQGSSFIIKANLHQDASLISFPEEIARARKNSVNLFEELYGLEVLQIRLFENERSFSILLANDFELLFKLHGRRANIIAFKAGQFHSLFRQHQEKDRAITPDQLDRPIDQCEAQILASSFDLGKLFPTFDKHIKNKLKTDGFFDETDPQVKLGLLKNLLEELNSGRQYITEINGLPTMLLFQPPFFQKSFDDPIEASNTFASQYFRKAGLSRLRNQLSGQVRKDIKKSESYLYQTKAKLAEIENRRSYEELANILMAHLHVAIDNGSKSIELTDVYTNELIRIKLKPNLSLQKNAEVLYRKAKNQAREISILTGNIKAREQALTALSSRLEQIQAAEDIKALKALDQSEVNKDKGIPQTPFMEFAIDGYQIYVGKNAKNNDLLTQKFAKKEDIWLHAKDVSGSHAIIRNPNGAKIPLAVIEKVAQIAAWYSKRKTDSLCPVIYTPKKYVRKPKGSLPGQVTLSQEKVVLVVPQKDVW